MLKATSKNVISAEAGIHFFRRSDEEKKEPSADLDLGKIEGNLKNTQTRRVKLNQVIQLANFESKIEYEGETIPIAEALELRKNLTSDLEAISEKSHPPL